MRNLWHPFTQMAEFEAEGAPTIVAADGCWLVDSEGRRYLDGVASLWANVHGHRHPHLDAAVRAQLDRFAHSTLLGLGSAPAEECARRLAEVAPAGLTRVFFASDGASAVEAALKMSIQFWRNLGRPEKRRFVALRGSYHGDTLGAVGVGDIPLFHEAFRGAATEAAAFLPVPHSVGLEAAVAEADRTLGALAGETAALVVEPVLQAAAGMIPQPPGYVAALAEICRRRGVLLLADEIATGFGRTGTMFACDRDRVVPDLLCLGKGITGGYLPLSATLATDRIYEAFLGRHAEARHFFHGHTYAGNALACAAAVATLDVFRDDRVMERLPAKIDRLWARLRAEVAPRAHVGEVRGVGMAVGVLLDGFPRARRVGREVALAARRRGVVIRPLGDVVVLFPPLAVADEEIDLLVDVVRDSIAEAAETN